MINLSLSQCYAALENLVPESSEGINNSDKEVLKTKISEILAQVLANDLTADETQNISKIRGLALRAQRLQLLTKDGVQAFTQVITRTKDLAVPILTYPEDYTLRTTDDKEVRVNLGVIKKNSEVMKNLIEDSGATQEFPVGLSERTLRFVLECLYAPEETRFNLPDDPPLIQELLCFAAGYGFDKLLNSLAAPLNKYLGDNSAKILEDNGPWLNALYLVRQSNPKVGASLNFMTVAFLRKINVPVHISGDRINFDVPIESLSAFFDAKSRDILRYLPVMLFIKDHNDLNTFMTACEANRQVEKLPIKLNCYIDLSADEEKTIKTMAAKSNNLLSFEYNILPYGTYFFGKNQWDEFIGHVDNLPYPPGLKKWLERDFCLPGPDGELIPTGKKWKDMGVLFLLPKTVGGKPLTPNLFRELFQPPISGEHCLEFDIVYEPIFEEYGNRPLERSVWAFLTKDVIDGTVGIPYDQQKAIIEAIPGCRVPDFFSTMVGIGTHFINTGIKLYKAGAWPYTRCIESTQLHEQIHNVIVGGFVNAGLDVDYAVTGVYDYGMAALIIFEDFPIE